MRGFASASLHLKIRCQNPARSEYGPIFPFKRKAYVNIDANHSSSGGASSSGEDNSSTTEIGLTTRMSTMSEIALPIRKQESFDNLYQSVPSGTVSFSRLPADEVNFLVDTEPTLRFFYKMPFKRFKQILTSMYSKDVSFLTSTMKHLGVKDTMRRLIKVSLYQQVIYCGESALLVVKTL